MLQIKNLQLSSSHLSCNLFPVTTNMASPYRLTPEQKHYLASWELGT